MTNPTPRTAAGRDLLADYLNHDEGSMRHRILAIEAEAATPDAGLRAALKEWVRTAAFQPRPLTGTDDVLWRAANDYLAATPSPAPLDVERLAAALADTSSGERPDGLPYNATTRRLLAEEIAGAYARSPASSPTNKP
jgi:hypothetical protein